MVSALTVLLLLSQVQFPDGYLSGSAPVTAGSLDAGYAGSCPAGQFVTATSSTGAPTCSQAGWITGFHCNVASQAFEFLDGGDGTTYSICGLMATVKGTHGPFGTALLDAGLYIVQWDAGTTSSTCIPAYTGAGESSGLSFLGTDMVPGLQPDTPIRVTVTYSALGPVGANGHTDWLFGIAQSSSSPLGMCMSATGTTLTGHCQNWTSTTTWTVGGTVYANQLRWQGTSMKGYAGLSTNCSVADAGSYTSVITVDGSGSVSFAANLTAPIDPSLARLYLTVGMSTTESPAPSVTISDLLVEYRPN